MAGVAVGLMWAAYAGILYAYILLKGYNVSPKELFSPTTWPPTG